MLYYGKMIVDVDFKTSWPSRYPWYSKESYIYKHWPACCRSLVCWVFLEDFPGRQRTPRQFRPRRNPRYRGQHPATKAGWDNLNKHILAVTVDSKNVYALHLLLLQNIFQSYSCLGKNIMIKTLQNVNNLIVVLRVVVGVIGGILSLVSVLQAVEQKNQARHQLKSNVSIGWTMFRNAKTRIARYDWPKRIKKAGLVKFVLLVGQLVYSHS